MTPDLSEEIKRRGKPRLKRIHMKFPADLFLWECSTLFGNGVAYGLSDTPTEAFLIWLYKPDYAR